MMMVVILAGGCIFAFSLVKEMFPESRPDKLMITAVYPAVQPQELERAITIKVEEAVRDVEGIEKVNSTVSEGISTTVVSLYNEVNDIDAVLQEVKNEVDALEDLPDDLEKITVNKLEPRLPVISVAIYGEGKEADLKRAARTLRDELLLLPGVSEVEINGIRKDEISVEIRPDRLLQYDITFDEVAEAIRSTNLDVSGGQLKGDRTSVAVRTLGEELRGIDLEDIIVRSQPDGRKIFLSDLAVIKDGFIESDLESYFNSQPSVNCVVFKTKTQDAIQIATIVKAFVLGKQNKEFDPYGIAAASQQSYPWKVSSLVSAYFSRGISVVASSLIGRPDPLKIYQASLANPFDHNYSVMLHTDLSRFVEGRLDLMTRNGKMGLVLVLISLNLFLNWRVALWAAIGLPVSFLGTFIVMWIFGASINLLSMFGLIIVLGIIVDDAIVIGENIYRHVEEGMPAKEAAIKGAEEVFWPVTVAVLTTIAAFAPLFFIKGQIGDFMGQLPIVVLAALLVSLIEALVILPAHLSNLPSKHEQLERAARRKPPGLLKSFFLKIRTFIDKGLHVTLTNLYERILRIVLRWRYVTVAVGVSALILSFGLLAGGIVERVFIQKMDSETLICFLEMPVGTTSDRVKSRLKVISEVAVSMPEVVNVQTFVSRQYDVAGVGSLGTNDQSHLGQLVIELKAGDQREVEGGRSSEELLAILRDLPFSSEYSSSLSGVNSLTWEAMNGGPGGKDIEIKVTGKKFSELVEVAKLMKSELAGYNGVFDLDDDIDEGKREVRLTLLETARPTGITVGLLGNHVRSAIYGSESRRITRNREDVKIMVRYPEEFRKNVYNLESMWIPTPQNSANNLSNASNNSPGSSSRRKWVPLKQVAELTESQSFNTIHRSQQTRSVTVLGSVNQDVANTSEILSRIGTKFDSTYKTNYPGVRIEFLGSFEERTKAFSGLKVAFPVALLMIYMLLAGLFRSYTQPLVVMSAIPFGLQGAIFGHWITDNPMTILSWIGMVALTGILVNDSLVLVDFINKRVRRGMSHFEASIQGSKLRLRAILLTTLTTVAGLTPLMFETSFQAKFLIPMAVTLTFGLVFATTLTLLIVPALNMIFYDFQKIYSRSQRPAQEESVESIAGEFSL